MQAWLEVLDRRVEEARDERQAQAAEIGEVRAFLAQLIDILGHRGDLNEGHRRLLGKIAQHARQPRKPAVKLSVIEDKYQVEGADVDCASLIPICKARCCAFSVPVAEQDIREGDVEWDIRDPYILSRGRDGYCIYLDRDSARCGCYDKRPGVCRTYDCRSDKRVWLDFERRIPAPLRHDLIPLSWLKQ